MTKTWLFSDPHLGHRNIVEKFDPPRPFKSIEEHDKTILDNYNSLVDDNDRVYFMGDLVMHRRHLTQLSQFKGRKKLIKGNHDIFKLKDYLPYFEDILAYRIYPQHGIIVSHIPIYLGQFDRWAYNFHGHTHFNKVQQFVTVDTGIGKMEVLEDDPRYINLCLEHTDYKPVELAQLLKKLGLVEGETNAV